MRVDVDGVILVLQCLRLAYAVYKGALDCSISTLQLRDSTLQGFVASTTGCCSRSSQTKLNFFRQSDCFLYLTYDLLSKDRRVGRRAELGTILADVLHPLLQGLHLDAERLGAQRVCRNSWRSLLVGCRIESHAGE